MSVASTILSAASQLSGDAAILHAIVTGPASGPTSEVALPGGGTVKTLRRVTAESVATGLNFPLLADLADPENDPDVIGTAADVDEDGNRYRWDGDSWELVGPSPDPRITAVEAATAGFENLLAVLTRSLVNQTDGAQADHALNTSGELEAASGRYATGFIPVTEAMAITRFGSAVEDGDFPPYLFYDANHAFIDLAWTTSSTSFDYVDLADAPDGTAYVRLNATNATVEYYLYHPALLEYLRDQMFSLFGTPNDVAGQLTNQFFNKSTGVLGNSSSWRLTGRLEVSADSFVCTGAKPVSETIATQAQLGFYGAASVKAITAIGQANPAPLEIVGHDFVDGQVIDLFVPTSAGMTQLSGESVTVTVVDADNITIDVDTTGYTAFVDDGATATGYPFLGFYNPKAANQSVRVGDLYDTAAYVRVAMRNGETGAVYITRSNPTYDLGLQELLSAGRIDWFAASLVVPGRIDDDGSIAQQTSPIWRTTPFISVVTGQVFHITFTDTTGTGPTVAAYDANGGYIAPLLQLPTNSDRIDQKVTVPATAGPANTPVAKIRAMYRNDKPDYHFWGARSAQAAQETANTANGLIYFAPDVAYGRIQNAVKEPVYLYTAGILGDRSVPLAFKPVTVGDWSSFQGDAVCRIVKPTQGESAVSVRAVLGTGRVEIGDIAVRVTDFDSAVSPAIPLNIVWIGDSTTSQLAGDASSIDGDGTATNEMMRQLTGVGDPALVVAAAGVDSLNTGSEWGAVVTADIRPAGTFTDIYHRGTRGNGTQKHNGYGGWHPSNFLERTNDFSMLFSAPLVAGNSVTGTMTDGTTQRTVGPIAFNTNNATTLADIAAAIQTEMRLYGTGANPPTAVVKDADEITIAPKWNLTFPDDPLDPDRWIVSGGASQATITMPGDGKFNAFWDPDLPGYGPTSEYQFSMARFLETYGWDYDAGTRPSGVRAGGANLAVFIELGANDVGDGTAAGTSAGHIGYMIDQVLREYPDAVIFVLGLWPPSNVNVFKQNTGSIGKWYSPAEIFDEVRAYGEAYRAVCTSSDREPGEIHFLWLAHQTDANYAYSKAMIAPGRHTNDSSLAIAGPGDVVHRRRRGYCDVADFAADCIAWHFLKV